MSGHLNKLIMVFTECEFSVDPIVHEVLDLGNLYGITNISIPDLDRFCILELKFLCLQ